MPLDHIATQIIDLLRLDGRMSYATLAHEVGLSEAAVRQRVLKLMDEGVMRIVAVTDTIKLGSTRQAMIGIQVADDARVVADRVARISEVDYVVITAGRYDVLAEVSVRTDEDLLDVIGRVHGTDGVKSVESALYLKVAKHAGGLR